MPNNARTNFDLMYCNAFVASTSLVNIPILINVSVTPVLGGVIKGELNASNDPTPFDSGSDTL